MVQSGQLDQILRDRRKNTVLGWMLCGFIALVVIEESATGNLLWAGFAAVVLALALFPPAAYHDLSVMLIGRILATSTLTSELATYFAVAAVALVIAVEIDILTPVRMTRWFAVLFVIIATLATAGTWALARWFSDLLLDTTFLYPESPRIPKRSGPIE
ncbi:MAG: hypothetical protein ABEI52_12685, partial [Halobacteriaceae archaeon]